MRSLTLQRLQLEFRTPICRLLSAWKAPEPPRWGVRDQLLAPHAEWKALVGYRWTMCFTKTDRTNYPRLISHTQKLPRGERILTAFLMSSYHSHFPLASQHREGTLTFPTYHFHPQRVHRPLWPTTPLRPPSSHFVQQRGGVWKETAASVNRDTYLCKNVSFWGVALLKGRTYLRIYKEYMNIFTFLNKNMCRPVFRC